MRGLIACLLQMITKQAKCMSFYSCTHRAVDISWVSMLGCLFQAAPPVSQGPVGAQRREAQPAGEAEKQRSVPFSAHSE